MQNNKQYRDRLMIDHDKYLLGYRHGYEDGYKDNLDLHDRIMDLKEALKIIANGETTVFDSETGRNVDVAMDEHEMSNIAREALK